MTWLLACLSTSSLPLLFCLHVSEFPFLSPSFFQTDGWLEGEEADFSESIQSSKVGMTPNPSPQNPEEEEQHENIITFETGTAS